MMVEIDKSMAYIGRKTCGCLTFAIVDSPERRKEVAREVAKALRLGEVVERVTCDEMRSMAWYCKEHQVERDVQL